MSDAIAGIGTLLKRGDGASAEVFTTIAEISNIDGPELERTLLDVTHLGSTGGYREFITGLRDAGELVLTLNFVRDTYEQLRLDWDEETSDNYQLEFEDTGGTTFDFAAVVTRLGLTVPFEDKIQVTATLKITGPLTLTS